MYTQVLNRLTIKTSGFNLRHDTFVSLTADVSRREKGGGFVFDLGILLVLKNHKFHATFEDVLDHFEEDLGDLGPGELELLKDSIMNGEPPNEAYAAIVIGNLIEQHYVELRINRAIFDDEDMARAYDIELLTKGLTHFTIRSRCCLPRAGSGRAR